MRTTISKLLLSVMLLIPLLSMVQVDPAPRIGISTVSADVYGNVYGTDDLIKIFIYDAYSSDYLPASEIIHTFPRYFNLVSVYFGNNEKYLDCLSGLSKPSCTNQASYEQLHLDRYSGFFQAPVLSTDKSNLEWFRGYFQFSDSQHLNYNSSDATIGTLENTNIGNGLFGATRIHLLQNGTVTLKATYTNLISGVTELEDNVTFIIDDGSSPSPSPTPTPPSPTPSPSPTPTPPSPTPSPSPTPAPPSPTPTPDPPTTSPTPLPMPPQEPTPTPDSKSETHTSSTPIPVVPVTPAPTPLPSTSPEPTTVVAPTYGTVQGTVFDTDGNPLPNILIELHSNPRETHTDVDGHYRFEHVELGNHTVILKAVDTLRELGKISVMTDVSGKEDASQAQLHLTKTKTQGVVDFIIEPLKTFVMDPTHPDPNDPDFMLIVDPPTKQPEFGTETGTTINTKLTAPDTRSVKQPDQEPEEPAKSVSNIETTPTKPVEPIKPTDPTPTNPVSPSPKKQEDYTWSIAETSDDELTVLIIVSSVIALILASLLALLLFRKNVHVYQGDQCLKRMKVRANHETVIDLAKVKDMNIKGPVRIIVKYRLARKLDQAFIGIYHTPDLLIYTHKVTPRETSEDITLMINL